MENTNLVRTPARDNGPLLDTAERIARLVSDGHFTIMKFTTNYRVSFNTPDGREDINEMAEGETLHEAMRNAIASVCGRPIRPITARLQPSRSKGGRYSMTQTVTNEPIQG